MSELAFMRMGIDTSDATATAGDILEGLTAYVNGTKLTGTLNPTQIVTDTLNLNSSSHTISLPSMFYGKNNVIVICLSDTVWTYEELTYVAYHIDSTFRSFYVRFASGNYGGWESGICTHNTTAPSISCSSDYLFSQGNYICIGW